MEKIKSIMNFIKNSITDSRITADASLVLILIFLLISRCGLAGAVIFSVLLTFLIIMIDNSILLLVTWIKSKLTVNK